MIIKLYNCTCEKQVLNKSNHLDLIIAVDGELRQNTSIVSPSIVFRLGNDDLGTRLGGRVRDDDKALVEDKSTKGKVAYKALSSVLTANYAYIPEFGRYYYVTDVTTLGNRLYSVSMTSDVLMSFRSSILNLTGFVNRYSGSKNDYLPDSQVPLKYNKIVTETAMGTDIVGKADKVLDMSPISNPWNTFDNVLVTIGYDNASLPLITGQFAEKNGTSSDVLQASPFSSAMNVWNSANNGMAWFSMSDYAVTYLYPLLLTGDKQEEYKTCILSLIRYPFDISPLVTPDIQNADMQKFDSKMLILGKETPNVFASDHISRTFKQAYNIALVSSFILKRKYNNYLDYSPYTTYELYLPFYGWVTLSPEQCLGHIIKVYYSFTWCTNDTTIYVTDETGQLLLQKITTQIGTPVNIGSTNEERNSKDRLSSGVSLALSGLTGGVSLATGIATANPIGILGGLLSGGKAVADYVSQQNRIIDKASCSVGNPSNDIYNPRKCRLRITRSAPVADNDTELEEIHALVGKPYNHVAKIGNLKGFVQMGFTRLKRFSTATAQEREEVANSLMQGIYIE